MSDNVVHAVAGAGGGIVSMTLTYPLVTIATRLAVQKRDDTKDAYKNAADAFYKILKREGVPGLYSGLSSALFGIAVTNGVYYYWYEAVRAYFEAQNKPLTTVQTLLSGGIAGAATATLTNPIWVVNTRMTARKRSLDESSQSQLNLAQKPPNAWETAMEMLREDGPLSFFQGLLPALVLVINPTMQYFAFEKLKAWMQTRKPKLGDLDFFILGAVSKLIATIVTYPYIVVKSRLQLKQSADSSQGYTGVADAFQKIIHQEGIAGLYKGLQSKIVQSVLTAAILFLAKERLFTTSMKLLVLLGARTALKQ